MSFFPRALASPAPPLGPVVEWEEPACLLCGGRNGSTLLEAPDCTAGGSGLWFAVVQCHDCGLCFTNPRPSQATISHFYPQVYRPHQVPRNRKRVRRELPTVLWHGQGRLLD